MKPYSTAIANNMIAIVSRAETVMVCQHIEDSVSTQRTDGWTLCICT